jgi:predicted phosphodiesterase
VVRIAVIADIHGNLPALEAVIADIERRAVGRTINLGDCVSGPLWPREVCELLMARGDLTIRGNHDRWVSEPNPTSMGASDRYAHSHLNQDQRSWLAALPASANTDHGILACHGTPASDNEYLIEDASEGRLVRASLATLKDRLVDTQSRVVLCGHSHQQHFIQLPDAPTILNPAALVARPTMIQAMTPTCRKLARPTHGMRSSTSMRIRYPPTWSQSPMIGRRLLLGLKATADPTGRTACARVGSSPAREHPDVRPVCCVVRDGRDGRPQFGMRAR